MWNFRPLALQNGCYERISRSTLMGSRSTLMGCYRSDNKRAAQAGVCIPPRPQQCRLRTCQWNVQSFSDGGIQNVIDTVVETKADVIVLNEFCDCGDEDYDNETRRYATQLLEQKHGYTVHCAQCPYPTAIATKNNSIKILQNETFALDQRRDAVALQVELIPSALLEEKEDKKQTAWIYATHLEDCDDANGHDRREEMETLLRKIASSKAAATEDEGAGILVIGDLNQQRQQDYLPDEWKSICANKLQRQSPTDDGVAGLLSKAGFSCIWDTNPPLKQCNWNYNQQNHPPPATHWTGTIVDYTYYYRNANNNNTSNLLHPTGVYVSPCDLSDHRLIVCDWNLTADVTK